MSLNSTASARTSASNLLRCQSMPPLQTGQRVLYQTVRCGAGIKRSNLSLAVTLRYIKESNVQSSKQLRPVVQDCQRVRSGQDRNPCAAAIVSGNQRLGIRPLE